MLRVSIYHCLFLTSTSFGNEGKPCLVLVVLPGIFVYIKKCLHCYITKTFVMPIQKYQNFLSENFHFLVIKFSDKKF